MGKKEHLSYFSPTYPSYYTENHSDNLGVMTTESCFFFNGELVLAPPAPEPANRPVAMPLGVMRCKHCGVRQKTKDILVCECCGAPL